ncbi:PAS domain-containing protein [Dyadobacter sediminis]|uniref:histidine kinase n=1 Tax=Dyadobacter sediminis TaxID=1493691 RepID=A0A5R9KQG9_9BACT|nr:PAS domain-containing protein [Dyadobacter sediminis]TLU98358.1 hypothetical protein FEM55_00325 [Dyadobacter sediminis]GGC14632.1 hypothetical protein GCM10011325_46870 [Dyadobacter sediminis]
MNSQQPVNPAPNLLQRLDLDFALRAAALGVWELDPVTQIINWDDQCRQFFGLSKKNQLSYDQAIEYVHSDDLERINQAVLWAMNPSSDGIYDQTYRTMGAEDGKLRWVRFLGRSYFKTEAFTGLLVWRRK